MKLSASTAATYAAMLGKLLPRGPIWDGAQAALGGLLTALGAELNEVHGRLVDLMEEAFPNTADEMLADWLRVWALPGPCSTMPTTDAGKRELLAGKVAAQGGQSRAYYIGIVRAILGDLEATVTITERPYGNVFRAWSGRAWDSVGGRGLAHYWRVTLPSGTTPSQVDAVDCVLQAYKPAHTVLEVIGLVSAYYESPGGAGDFLEASTSLAAREIFPASGTPIDWSIGFWLEREAGTADELCLFSVSDEADPGYESTLQALVFDPVVSSDGISINLDGVPGSVSLGISPYPDTSTWTRFGFTFDATLGELRVFVDGVEVAADADPSFAWVPGSIFRLLGLFAGGQELDGRVRNILINRRQHSAAEEQALSDAGPRHDVRAPYGDDWAGETPPIYWCRSAVPGLGAVGFWHLDGSGSGAMAEVDGETAANEFGFGRSLLFWMRVTQADEGGAILRLMSTRDETIQFMDISLAAGGDFVLTLTASNGLIDGVSPTSDALPFGAFDFYALDLDLLGIGRLYRNNALICETAGPVPEPGVGSPDPYLWFQGNNLNIVDITNVMILDRLTTSDERASLTLAGPGHDLTAETGDWAGEDTAIRWPDGGLPNAGTGGTATIALTGDATVETEALPGGVTRVPNSGSAGVCDLNLYGSTSSHED